MKLQQDRVVLDSPLKEKIKSWDIGKIQAHKSDLIFINE